LALIVSSWRSLRATSFGVAPDDVTAASADRLVMATVNEPAPSTQPPP
jgi:hypothetical protein